MPTYLCNAAQPEEGERGHGGAVANRDGQRPQEKQETVHGPLLGTSGKIWGAGGGRGEGGGLPASAAAAATGHVQRQLQSPPHVHRALGSPAWHRRAAPPTAAGSGAGQPRERREGERRGDPSLPARLRRTAASAQLSKVSERSGVPSAPPPPRGGEGRGQRRGRAPVPGQAGSARGAPCGRRLGQGWPGAGRDPLCRWAGRDPGVRGGGGGFQLDRSGVP